jgi:uncharacterized membrane protein
MGKHTGTARHAPKEVHVLRSTRDRIRHAISFEIIGLALVIPLGALLFHLPVAQMGFVGVVSATLATLWNYLYNLGFDHMLQRRTGSTRKGPVMRITHAVLFEGTLLLILLPFIAWHLGISIMAALAMDVSFALFYVA